MPLLINKISAQLLIRLKENALPLLLLLALTAVTYWEVTTHSILINWDDNIYITTNSAIRGFSLQNLKAAFTGYYVGNYAPVQILSYMIDYALWGDNPLGYFLANISYHFISGVLLYFLLLRFGFWKWGAFFGTALFLVHPVQVESVAWLSQRKNLLAMMMSLLSFHAYLSYRQCEEKTARRWSYLWSVAAFTLALLSKSVAVIFPVMLVMYDLLVPPVRRKCKDYSDKIPYVVAAGIIAVIAMISQESDNGGGRIEYPPNPLVVLPLSMLPVLVRYLTLLVCPLPSLQSIMYFPPLRSEIDPAVITSLCVLAGLMVVGIFLYRKNRPCLFWYAIFFLGLIPVSQIVPLATMMNDRYLYFPMMGVAGLIAHLSGFLLERAAVRWWGKVVLTVSVGIILTMSFASYERGKVWHNSISLFSDAVAKYPNQANTWSRLAEGYIPSNDLTTAKYYYENAARFGDLDAEAQHNLAKIYLISGEYDKAYQHIFRLLLREDQGKVNMLLLGEYYFRIASYPEAEQYIMSYLEENPTDTNALYLLGRVYFMSGDYGLARECYYRAATEESVSADWFYGMACLEFMEGHLDQCFTALKSAFEKGLTAKNMHEDERCLAGMKSDPRLGEMIRRFAGE